MTPNKWNCARQQNKITWVARNDPYRPSATATPNHGVWRTIFTRTPQYANLYIGVAIFQLLTHLYDNYRIITAVDIENNDEEMRTTCNPTLIIETLFHQIEGSKMNLMRNLRSSAVHTYSSWRQDCIKKLAEIKIKNWIRIRLGNLSRFSSRQHIVTCV